MKGIISAEREEVVGRDEILPGYPRYRVHQGRIEAARLEGKGEARGVAYYPLANFACTIRREVRRTDGVQEELLFELEGHTPAGPLPAVRVRAAEFSAMAWPVREWGARAIVAPGNGVRDQLRAAIQHLSNPERTTVYAHTGWVRQGADWVYLHAGGGIGREGSMEGIEVDLPPELAGFILPDPPTGEAAREARDLALKVSHRVDTLAPASSSEEKSAPPGKKEIRELRARMDEERGRILLEVENRLEEAEELMRRSTESRIAALESWVRRVSRYLGMGKKGGLFGR